MTSRKLNVARMAAWGAILGAPFLLARMHLSGESLPEDGGVLTGFVIGGMLLGAALGAVFALIRNSTTT